MAIHQWADGILLVELDDEPQFSDEMQGLLERLTTGSPADVVLNLSAIEQINSSNLAQLLRVRQKLIDAQRRLVVCCVPDSIWGVMLVTGLDKVFEFAPETAGALASLQLKR